MACQRLQRAVFAGLVAALWLRWEMSSNAHHVLMNAKSTLYNALTSENFGGFVGAHERNESHYDTRSSLPS
jgi:hypothetical protein